MIFFCRGQGVQPVFLVFVVFVLLAETFMAIVFCIPSHLVWEGKKKKSHFPSLSPSLHSPTSFFFPSQVLRRQSLLGSLMGDDSFEGKPDHLLVVLSSLHPGFYQGQVMLRLGISGPVFTLTHWKLQKKGPVLLFTTNEQHPIIWIVGIRQWIFFLYLKLHQRNDLYS